MRKRKIKNALSLLLAAGMGLFLVPAMPASAANDSGYLDPGIAYRSEQDVRDYLKSHPVSAGDPTYAPTYDEEPVLTAPYSAGKLSAETKQDGLNALNQMRYIAGLNEVGLDDSVSDMTQTGSLINCVNDQISHYPDKPTGMSDEMYKLGSEGTKKSNLGMGYSSLSESVIYGYMYDGIGESNRQTVGHRRWCINPAMEKTNFGFVGKYSSLYAHDRSKTAYSEKSVWPANNMPIEYFRGDQIWSFSTGEEEDDSKVSVYLKNETTGQEWNFSKASTPDKFRIDNEWYALRGCIMFEPGSKIYSETHDGDKFTVIIKGTKAGNYKYSVRFFYLSVPVRSVELDKKEITLNVGETAKINATVVPDNAANKKVGWFSSNPSIVKVDDDGNVTALKPGTATIEVTTKSTNVVMNKCTVTVKSREFTSTGNVFDNPNDDTGSTFEWGKRTSDGETIVLKNGEIDKNEFISDGSYTYYVQADGTVMKDRLTYHPDGEHIIYFDEKGHEVFNTFAHPTYKITSAGNEPVADGDQYYFNMFGYMYKNTVTYDVTGTKLYYIDGYGCMQHNGWFKFDPNAGYGDTPGAKWSFTGSYIGFANYDGTLLHDAATFDYNGTPCYMQGNGEAAY